MAFVNKSIDLKSRTVTPRTLSPAKVKNKFSTTDVHRIVQSLPPQEKSHRHNFLKKAFGIFPLLIEFEASLFVKLMKTNKKLRELLCEEYKLRALAAVKKFKITYNTQLQLISTYLCHSEMTYGQQTWSRIDRVFKFKVLRPCQQ